MQRRKSVCKRSCTVRGMRPPQGPACVRLRLGIFAKIIEKQQKNLSFVKDLNSNKAFCVFQVCAKHFHCRSNPYRNLSFLYYFCCFCMNPIRYPYTSGSLRRPHPTYGTGSFAHTFSTLQKRPLLSKGVYDIRTRAGPKKLPKSCLFFGTGPTSLTSAASSSGSWRSLGHWPAAIVQRVRRRCQSCFKPAWVRVSAAPLLLEVSRNSLQPCAIHFE